MQQWRWKSSLEVEWRWGTLRMSPKESGLNSGKPALRLLKRPPSEGDLNPR